MTVPPRIDFDPSLFDDERPQPVLSTAGKAGVRRLNRWGVAVAVLAGGAVVALGAMAVMRSNDVDLIDSLHQLGTALAPAGNAVPTAAELTSGMVPVPSARPVAVHPVAKAPWCSSEMLMCSTVVTGRPAETLQRLTSTLALDKRQQYRVRITIEPIDQL